MVSQESTINAQIHSCGIQCTGRMFFTCVIPLACWCFNIPWLTFKLFKVAPSNATGARSVGGTCASGPVLEIKLLQLSRKLKRACVSGSFTSTVDVGCWSIVLRLFIWCGVMAFGLSWGNCSLSRPMLSSHSRLSLYSSSESLSPASASSSSSESSVWDSLPGSFFPLLSKCGITKSIPVI